jgi:hypothetical protein
MGEEHKMQQERQKSEKAPHRITLPGWIVKEDKGLGDAVGDIIYRVTRIKPCAGCLQRKASLNRRFVLSPRR